MRRSTEGRVRISVEVYGGIAVGCVGIFFYAFHSYEMGMSLLENRSALLNLEGPSGGRPRWGLPFPQDYSFREEGNPEDPSPSWAFPLLHWRF